MRWLVWLVPILLAAVMPFVRVSAQSPPLKAQVKPPKKVAVLVGTNEYTDRALPSLRFCEADMLALKVELEKAGFKVIVLLGSGEGDAEATRQNIVDRLVNDDESNTKYAFRDLTSDDDVAVVAFSGHGQQIIVTEDKKEIETPFYCPKRAKSGVPETLVSLNAVLKGLNGTKAKGLLLVDACRQFTERKEQGGQKSAKGLGLDRSVVQGLRKNVGGMFACDDRQTAIEIELDPKNKTGHGAFFQAVLTTLRSADGELTWEEVVPKVRKQVNALTGHVDEEYRQKPQSFGSFSAEVVLIRKGEVKRSSAEGEKTLTIGDVKGYDETGGFRIAHFGPGEEVRVLVFQNDSSAKQYEARLVDLKLGKSIHAPFQHQDEVTSACFSPDGTKVVTASNDGTAVVRDAGKGSTAATLNMKNARNPRAVFSPDGVRLAVAGEYRSDTGTLGPGNICAVWDLPSGDNVLAPVNSGPRVAFSPDGSRLAACGGHENACVFSLDKKSNPMVIQRRGGNHVSFSPDGSLIIIGNSDNTATLWQAKSGEKIATLKHTDSIYHTLFTPDGSKVLTASIDRTVGVWDVQTCERVATLNHGDFRIEYFAFSSDGAYLVTGTGMAQVWETKTWSRTTILDAYSGCKRAMINSDGSKVVTWGGSWANLWDVRTGKKIGGYQAK